MVSGQRFEFTFKGNSIDNQLGAWYGSRTFEKDKVDVHDRKELMGVVWTQSSSLMDTERKCVGCQVLLDATNKELMEVLNRPSIQGIPDGANLDMIEKRIHESLPGGGNAFGMTDDDKAHLLALFERKRDDEKNMNAYRNDCEALVHDMLNFQVYLNEYCPDAKDDYLKSLPRDRFEYICTRDGCFGLASTYSSRINEYSFADAYKKYGFDKAMYLYKKDMEYGFNYYDENDNKDFVEAMKGCSEIQITDYLANVLEESMQSYYDAYEDKKMEHMQFQAENDDYPSILDEDYLMELRNVSVHHGNEMNYLFDKICRMRYQNTGELEKNVVGYNDKLTFAPVFDWDKVTGPKGEKLRNLLDTCGFFDYKNMWVAEEQRKMLDDANHNLFHEASSSDIERVTEHYHLPDKPDDRYLPDGKKLEIDGNKVGRGHEFDDEFVEVSEDVENCIVFQ